MLPEEVGKVGTKGELYPPKKIRQQLNLLPESRVRYFISPKGYLIVEKIVSIEEILSKPPLAKISVAEIENLSEETQKMEGKVID